MLHDPVSIISDLQVFGSCFTSKKIRLSMLGCSMRNIIRWLLSASKGSGILIQIWPNGQRLQVSKDLVRDF